MQQPNTLRILTPTPQSDTNPSPVKQINLISNTPHQDIPTSTEQ